MNANPELTAKQAHWLRHLESCRKSGRSMREYAAKHDLPLPQLYTWRSRLRQMGALPADVAEIDVEQKRTRGSKVRFRAIRLIDQAEPTASGVRIRFANGVVVELDGSGSRSVDTSLLSFLASMP